MFSYKKNNRSTEVPYLEMIFLLTNESIIGIAKVESLISVDSIMRNREFFKIVITESMPRSLLKRMKTNALITCVNVITIACNFISLKHCAITTTTSFHRSQFRFLLEKIKKPLLQTISR